MTQSDDIKLSIIIVNWNTRQLLNDCLASLKTYLPDTISYEVIVVDNGSSDNSVEMVRQLYPEVILLDAKENLGFVGGNNAGYKESKGEYILLLNSDTVILDSNIDKIIRFFDDNNDVAVVTGKVLNSDGSFQTPFRRLPSPVGAAIRHSIRLVVGFNTVFHKRYMMSGYTGDKQMDVECVTGAYLFVRRSVLENEPVLDKDIFMFYEDTLLCAKIKAKGYRLVYLPIAPIIHYGGESTKSIQARAGSYSLLSSIIFFQKTRNSIISFFYKNSVLALIQLLKVSFMILRFVPYPKFNEKYILFRDMNNYIRGRLAS